MIEFILSAVQKYTKKTAKGCKRDYFFSFINWKFGIIRTMYYFCIQKYFNVIQNGYNNHPQTDLIPLKDRLN